MQQSNGYILGFTAVVTVVLGGLLAFTSISLKEKQNVQIELDTKKKILSCVVSISDEMSTEEILAKYDERIQSFVIDANGDNVDSEIPADKIDVAKEYAKAKEDRHLPVFALRDEVDPSKFEAYIVSVYGKGLWGPIWGFVALGSDLNTIQGAVFDHKTETPGLGARITDKEVQQRFEGKTIFDGKKLTSVEMVKGEGNDPDKLTDHKVDGLSGASMTTKGVNKMLVDFLGTYSFFFQEVASNGIGKYLDEDSSTLSNTGEEHMEGETRLPEKVTIHPPTE